MTVVTRSRELSAAGWSPDRIVEMFAQDGILVARSTVFRWAKVREQRRAAQRDRLRRERASSALGMGPMGHPLATPQYKLARMRALRELVEMKDTKIARLMLHDFGDEMTSEMVSHALVTGRYPRSLR